MDKNTLLSTPAHDHPAMKTKSRNPSMLYLLSAMVVALVVSVCSVSYCQLRSDCPTTKIHQDFYNFLLSPRHYENVTVMSLDPLRVRVDGRFTSPNGDVMHFSTEGAICETGYTDAVGEAVCRQIGRKYEMADRNVTWTPDSADDVNNHCYFRYFGEIITVPCGFILENLQCAANEQNLVNCIRTPLFVHNCLSNRYITIFCSAADCVPFEPLPRQSACEKPKWTQEGITVAGNGTPGNTSMQLNWPMGIFIDHNDDLYVADQQNNRVQKFKSDSKIGTTIGEGAGTDSSRLSYPEDVFVDPSGAIFIGDTSHGRIQKWSPESNTAETVVKLDSCCILPSLFLDEQGNSYVIQWYNHTDYRVVKYAFNSKTEQKTLITHKMNDPRGLYVDRCGTVYVGDARDGTVQKYFSGTASKGIILAKDRYRLWDITLDRYGNVYIVEMENNRILRLSVRDGSVEQILSGYDLRGPWSIAFDSHDNLFLSDHWNHRIQKFVFEGGDVFC